jgi:hypothetical protein
MKETLFLFGLGTGRCGTVSLAKLLNSQKGASVTHEARPWLPWETNLARIGDKAASLRRKACQQNYGIVGDVALFNLKSVERLIELFPKAKFVALMRDHEQTIDSFKRKWRPKYNRLCIKKVEWDYVFPHYEYEMTVEEAVSMYYSEYYAKVFILQKKYPQNVKCFNTQVLNDKDGVISILDFCGISEKDRIVQVGIKVNKGHRV